MNPIPPSQATIDAGYAAWVAEHDTLSRADRSAIVADLAALRAPPVISLLLPLGFHGPGDWRDTLATVRAQLYQHWQLCIAGEPPDADALAAWAGGDPRVFVAAGPRPDPADAANAALALADGEFVALLAAGDTLPAHALYEVAVELARYPDCDLLYTDEDRIDHAGQRLAPRLKTGWDPDLLLACDYVGALAVYRRGAVLDAGGWRAGLEGAAGYDLALRLTGGAMPDRVRHLPAVLYHRPAAGDGSMRDRMFNNAALAARRVAQAFLGAAARVTPSPLLPSLQRIVWPVPEPAPLVSIVMPTRDRAWLLVPAAWGVLSRTDYPSFELLIVDNDSCEDITAAALRDLAGQPNVRIVRHPGPFNFSAMNNAAVREAKGEVIVLLNNDVDVISPGWLRELVSQAMRPDVGAVGARLLYADGSLQHSGVVLGPGLNATHILRCSDRGDPGYGGQLAATRAYSVVTGACLAIRRAVYLEAGGLNEDDLAVAFNDVDLCLRLGELGYRVIATPFAELFHLESQSRGTPDTPEKLARELREVDFLWRSWRHAFARDPFHNPNLSCAWNDPLHLSVPRRARPWQRAKDEMSGDEMSGDEMSGRLAASPLSE
jgi:O-antigen biosynthesis protein